MVETANRNAERIAGYAYTHGAAQVERLLDAVLALEDHVDPYADREQYEATRKPGPKQRPAAPGPYDDLWGLAERAAPERERAVAPSGPYRDLLLFLLERSPVLDDWERDVVAIVRQERLYFEPQMRTKIINEGWAVFWHLRLLRALDLTPQEYVDFLRLHAGVLQPSRRSLNPYHLGATVLEDINRRHGGNETDVAPVMFEIRERESDISLLRNYLTKELVEDLDLYLYEQRGDELVVAEKDFEKVRDALVASLQRRGHPSIVVQDGDYRGNRELYLRHEHEGQGLDLPYAEKALEHVHRLWGRRVHLETRLDDKPLILSYAPDRGHKRDQSTVRVSLLDNRRAVQIYAPHRIVEQVDRNGLRPLR